MKCITIAALLILIGCSDRANDQIQTLNYAEHVNTTIGSKGKGHGVSERYLEAGYTFPGAMYPFGMVQFTPTFFTEEKGFVINQLSGAGCDHMGNLPTLPVAGELKNSPNDMMGLNPQYKINKAIASHYSVTLGSNQVTCDLTVTKRSAMAKFTFPDTTKRGTIIIGTGINSNTITKANAIITGKNTFEGYADGGTFCGYKTGYMVYFAGEFDREVSASGAWKDKSVEPSAQKADGQNSGLYFTFDVSSGKSIQYKIGISYVSIKNAKENLAAENSAWDFEATKEATKAAWNNYLGRIKVEGGSEDKTIQFYTHLYHAFTHPGIFSDVNGEYIGADFNVHKAEGFTYYTGFSNWDTYRTQVQLLSMLAPAETSDMMQSIIQFAEQSGGGWPRWVLANIETGIMQGDPTSALVANAYAFGAKDFDTKTALAIMKRSATVPGTKSQEVLTRIHLEDYLKTGYTEASMSLEYNNADFAIAQFALQAHQDSATYKAFLSQSQTWKKLYNPERKWLQSKNQDGTWKKPTDDWREASYKNYFWMVPYNLKTLIDTIGGEKVAEERLDEFFVKLNANYNQEWFAAGNEPDFQVPWIYNWAGVPSKTQSLVRRIIKEQYSNRDNGLPGNDDMGAMGAWYVYANIGLYPVIPGVGGFSVNSPSFSKVVLQIGDKPLVITGGSETKPFIKSLSLNDGPVNSTWIPLEDLAKGGSLEFELSDSPDNDWAKSAELPSFDADIALPGWALGEFIRPKTGNPVISPISDTQFDCPMYQRKIDWESNDTFNPAATVYNDQICVLYRAEDKSGEGIGGRTSRIGLAVSEDGIQMKRMKTPVLFPSNDNQKENEWTGGCEDPRVAVTEDGVYVMLYTQWNKKVPRLAVATSKDLKNWEKHGPAFETAYKGKYHNMATKSASIVTKVVNDKQVITKVNGKYFMYWGEKRVYAATSSDLKDWQPLEDGKGELKILMLPRRGYFDSQLTECGPPAVMTKNGIVLLYNGKNLEGPEGDKLFTANSYCAGQALFDARDPALLKARLDKPFLVPTESFEKSGQYPAGTVFIEGLVYFRKKWFLYFGCADSRVAVAISDQNYE